MKKISVVVLYVLCAFFVGAMSTYADEATQTVTFDLGAAISMSCTDSVSMNPIIGTGQSVLDGNNLAGCAVRTNAACGYTLSWHASTEDMINGLSDHFAAYAPAASTTPEVWDVPNSVSAWGAKLAASSTTYNTSFWGNDDSYTGGKWLDVTNDGSRNIATRTSETSNLGDQQTIVFGAEIGSDKIQPTGSYQAEVVMTALADDCVVPTPNAFSFTDQTGAETSTITSSNAVTLSEFTGPLTATCGSGCTDIARNGSWAASTTLGGFMSGDTIAMRQTSSASYSTATTASVTVGITTSGTWSVTTRAQDTTPNAFSFTDQTGVTRSTIISSNAVAISGFEGPLTATCGLGCTDIARNGSWAASTTLGGFMSGDTIAIRQTSSASYSTATTASVTVGITTSGTWSVTTEAQPDPFGPEYMYITATTYYNDVAKLDSTHFVVAYADSTATPPGRAVVGTVTGNSVSYGSVYTFNNANTAYVRVKALDSSTIVVVYQDVASSQDGTAIIGTISGSTITWGAEYKFETDTATFPALSIIDSTHFVVGYNRVSPANAQAIVGTVSGTTISFGSKYTMNAAQTAYIDLDQLDSTHFVAAYKDNDGLSYGKAIIGTISGSTITFGTEATFNAGLTNYITATALDSTHFAVGYEDQSNSNRGTAIVGSVSGSTITYGSEYVFDSSTASTQPLDITTLDSTHIAISTTDGVTGYGEAMIGTVSSGTVLSYGGGYTYNSAGTLYVANAGLDSAKFVTVFEDTLNSSVYTCNPISIANATLCANDDTGLTANTSSTVVTACGVPKCEFTCNTGFTKSGNVCVPLDGTTTCTINPVAIGGGQYRLDYTINWGIYNLAAFVGSGGSTLWESITKSSSPQSGSSTDTPTSTSTYRITPLTGFSPGPPTMCTVSVHPRLGTAVIGNKDGMP